MSLLNKLSKAAIGTTLAAVAGCGPIMTGLTMNNPRLNPLQAAILQEGANTFDIYNAPRVANQNNGNSDNSQNNARSYGADLPTLYYPPLRLNEVDMSMPRIVHNVVDADGDKGMDVYVDLTIRRHKGETIDIDALLCDENGRPYKNPNAPAKNLTTDGQVIMPLGNIKPGFEETIYRGVRATIYYQNIDRLIDKSGVYGIQYAVFDMSGETPRCIGTSTPEKFRFNKD